MLTFLWLINSRKFIFLKVILHSFFFFSFPGFYNPVPTGLGVQGRKVGQGWVIILTLHFIHTVFKTCPVGVKTEIDLWPLFTSSASSHTCTHTLSLSQNTVRFLSSGNHKGAFDEAVTKVTCPWCWNPALLSFWGCTGCRVFACFSHST